MNQTDHGTIAAIASGITASGIGVIRISGPESIRIADMIFASADHQKLADAKPYTMHYGFIEDDSKKIDEAVALVFRAPHSYTGEDTIELDAHGGSFVMQKILSLLIQKGAAPAEPGEFSKRAFLNGKLDLSQAESVMDIISSTNDEALRASVSQLSGSLSAKIRTLRESLIHEIAWIESALDDPEHYSLDGYYDTLHEKITTIRSELSALLDTYQYGRFLNDGIRTVIIGNPNVGKSSLMNALLGEDRAIVTEIAGTTRDTLSERINIGGLTLHVIDTAGIHESVDKIEKIGIERAKKSIEDADLILLVLDGTQTLSEETSSLFDLLSEKQSSGKVIALVNKADQTLQIETDRLKAHFPERYLEISAKYDSGIAELKAMILAIFQSGALTGNEEIIITNIRHQKLLSDALEKTNFVLESIDNRISEDFISSDLTLIYETLGFIIGESLGDDVVDRVFSEFCMGK